MDGALAGVGSSGTSHPRVRQRLGHCRPGMLGVRFQPHRRRIGNSRHRSRRSPCKTTRRSPPTRSPSEERPPRPEPGTAALLPTERPAQCSAKEKSRTTPPNGLCRSAFRSCQESPRIRCLGVTSFWNYTFGGRQRKRNRRGKGGRRRAEGGKSARVSARRHPAGALPLPARPARTEAPASRRASGRGRSTGTVRYRTASPGSPRNSWSQVGQRIDSRRLFAKPQAAFPLSTIHRH